MDLFVSSCLHQEAGTIPILSENGFGEVQAFVTDINQHASTFDELPNSQDKKIIQDYQYVIWELEQNPTRLTFASSADIPEPI